MTGELHRRLFWAAGALLLLQVIHGAVPADTDAEGVTGLIAGLVALIANITALVGLRRGRAWAVDLAGITGLSVAVGFVLYHAIPVHSVLTNPYWGEVGVGPWIPVVAVVAAGLTTGWYAYRLREADTSVAGATA